jgi:predicted ATPase
MDSGVATGKRCVRDGCRDFPRSGRYGNVGKAIPEQNTARRERRERMAITLEARNYRCLRHALWTPSGVSVLVGPNGSGKSTLLGLFTFFHDVYASGVYSALKAQGGSWGLRHLEAAPDESVVLGLTVNDLRWEMTFGDRVTSNKPPVTEKITRGPETLFALRITEDGPTTLRNVYGTDAARTVEPLVTAVKNLRLYQSWDLLSLRRKSSPSGSDLYLSPSGENAFSVLRNWHSRKALQPKYEFVVEGLRAAFPDLCENLDFNFDGPTTTVEMNLPGRKGAVPAAFTPNGWLTALLHLCAVAGGEPGSLLAIDEMENGLHPYAIRKLLEAFREWAGDHDLTICLATHSPVLLDEFKDEPENVFVLEHGQETGPVALANLYDADWLSRFSLGRLYSHGDFGGQRKDVTPAVPASQGS